MGCDIHPVWEVQSAKSNKWMCKGGVQCLGRDYAFFSLIADVRNGSSIGNGYIQPFFAERGVPDDSVSEVRMEFENCCDYHSASHFYLDEFKNAFENEMNDLKITYSTKFTLLEYYKHKKNIRTYNHAYWMLDDKVKEVSVEEFENILKDDDVKCMLELNTIPEKHKYSITKTSEYRPYKDEFMQTYKELMLEAKSKFKNKPLSKIRLVYWFDN